MPNFWAFFSLSPGDLPAIANLIRLSHLTENPAYLQQAEQALQAFASILQQSPTACPSLFVALDHFLNGALIRTTPELVPDLILRYLPTIGIRCDRQLPSNAIALVCQGLSCLEPAESQEMLIRQIQQMSS